MVISITYQNLTKKVLEDILIILFSIMVHEEVHIKYQNLYFSYIKYDLLKQVVNQNASNNKIVST